MGLRIIGWRVVPLTAEEAGDAAGDAAVFGIEGHVEGDGWVGMSRDDDGDRRLTFPTRGEAEEHLKGLPG